jgi:hypothetical protein
MSNQFMGKTLVMRFVLFVMTAFALAFKTIQRPSSADG